MIMEKRINTNLRIRLTLNNGISALLGQSKSNKTSTFSIQLQQDNIKNLLKTTEIHSMFL